VRRLERGRRRQHPSSSSSSSSCGTDEEEEGRNARGKDEELLRRFEERPMVYLVRLKKESKILGVNVSHWILCTYRSEFDGQQVDMEQIWGLEDRWDCGRRVFGSVFGGERVEGAVLIWCRCVIFSERGGWY
jgi:hypothetical protein